jgi:hypothetical protein
MQHWDTQEQKKTTTTSDGGAAKLNHNHRRFPRSKTRSPPFWKQNKILKRKNEPATGEEESDVGLES